MLHFLQAQSSTCFQLLVYFTRPGINIRLRTVFWFRPLCPGRAYFPLIRLHWPNALFFPEQCSYGAAHYALTMHKSSSVLVSARSQCWHIHERV